MNCERCRKETHFLEDCAFCQKKVCRACVRSNKVASEKKRVVVCRTCFGDASKKKAYKRAG